MFAIRLLDRDSLDLRQLGEIVVGSFRETFSCHANDFAAMQRDWRDRLMNLVRGESVVVLKHDPRFAWVLYHDGDVCHVQQVLSPDGKFSNILPRITMTDDGERVSEWSTTIAAVREFLEQDEHHAQSW